MQVTRVSCQHVLWNAADHLLQSLSEILARRHSTIDDSLGRPEILSSSQSCFKRQPCAPTLHISPHVEIKLCRIHVTSNNSSKQAKSALMKPLDIPLLLMSSKTATSMTLLVGGFFPTQTSRPDCKNLASPDKCVPTPIEILVR